MNLGVLIRTVNDLEFFADTCRVHSDETLNSTILDTDKLLEYLSTTRRAELKTDLKLIYSAFERRVRTVKVRLIGEGTKRIALLRRSRR